MTNEQERIIKPYSQEEFLNTYITVCNELGLKPDYGFVMDGLGWGSGSFYDDEDIRTQIEKDTLKTKE